MKHVTHQISNNGDEPPDSSETQSVDDKKPNRQRIIASKGDLELSVVSISSGAAEECEMSN